MKPISELINLALSDLDETAVSNNYLNLSDKKQAYWLTKAQYYLAQRDHARAELKLKLQQLNQRLKQDTLRPNAQANVCENSLLESVLDYCEEKKWLNDARYAVLYVQSRHKKGVGKQKLNLELQQKGVSRDIANQTLKSCEIDFFTLAKHTAEKKFGELLATKDPQQKAKIQRFLQSRGFSFDEINEVFD